MFKSENISLKNDKAWQLIQNGYTLGVFQLESDLGKKWSVSIKPTNINELSAVISLIRPACLESGMTETYSKVKNGSLETPDYKDDVINGILSPTMGVLIYQEQLMKFGGEIAWKDMPYLERLVIVDKLRKGIGKKDQRIIIDLKDKFINGCIKNGRSRDTAERLFGLIEGAGRYAFNDAHAKKYALWSYRTAYLKANYPIEFYCVYLTYSKGKQKPRDEIHALINEGRMLGINIQSPSISKSKDDFSIQGNQIIYGLSHIKQVGGSDAEVIINNRPKSYVDLLKLHFANNETKLRSLALESLINSGCCDEYKLTRSTMLGVYSMLKEFTPREIEFIFSITKEQTDVSGLIDIVKMCADKKSIKKRREIVMSEANAINLLSQDSTVIKGSTEKELMGFSFSYDDNVNIEDDWSCQECFNKMKNNRKITAVFTAKLDKIKQTTTKKGKNPGQEMAQMTITDNTGSINVVCFPSQYEIYKKEIYEGCYCTIQLKGTGYGWSVETIKIN